MAKEIVDSVSEIKNRKMELENELSVYLYRQREDLKTVCFLLNNFSIYFQVFLEA